MPQRDVVYPGWPIVPWPMSPNAGGGGRVGGVSAKEDIKEQPTSQNLSATGQGFYSVHAQLQLLGNIFIHTSLQLTSYLLLLTI